MAASERLAQILQRATTEELEARGNDKATFPMLSHSDAELEFMGPWVLLEPEVQEFFCAVAARMGPRLTTSGELVVDGD
jgi:hypothetical protein